LNASTEGMSITLFARETRARRDLLSFCPSMRRGALRSVPKNQSPELKKKKKKNKTKPKKKTGKSSKGGAKGARVSELEMTIAAVEKERNFYFGKLREIEILCQEFETVEPVGDLNAAVLKIMYKTDDDGEFAGEGDEEEVEVSVGDDEDNTTF